MSVIVERLRADARFIRGEPDCIGPRVTLLSESAADEITALRAEVERLQGIEALYKAGCAAWNPAFKVFKAVLDERDALRARVEELKGVAQFAMDRINEWVLDGITDDLPRNHRREWYGHVSPALDRLRAALEEKP